MHELDFRIFGIRTPVAFDRARSEVFFPEAESGLDLDFAFSSTSCVWKFPSEFDALFVAEGRTQSRCVNHRRGIVRRWHANTIQQHDTARNGTRRSRNFWATEGGNSIGP